MANIRLRGRAQLRERLTREQRNTIRNDMQQDVSSLLRDLEAITPRDTGFAAGSWSATLVSGSGNELTSDISNPAEYIQRLNEGSSTQAPARFIENAAARYFTQLRPLGGRR